MRAAGRIAQSGTDPLIATWLGGHKPPQTLAKQPDITVVLTSPSVLDAAQSETDICHQSMAGSPSSVVAEIRNVGEVEHDFVFASVEHKIKILVDFFVESQRDNFGLLCS